MSLIRQISDYSLSELNDHLQIINNIPSYIMDWSRRNYWANQIQMRKNMILDDIEQRTCIYNRHVKVEKWIEANKSAGYIIIDDKIFNKYINKEGLSYHDFYFANREKIEQYFLDLLEKNKKEDFSYLNIY